MPTKSEGNGPAATSTLRPASRPRRKIRAATAASRYPERMAAPRDPPKLSRLVIASNRLPVSLTGNADDGWRAQPAAGGLVTALSPVMRERGGVWVGWPGAPDTGETELRQAVTHGGIPGNGRSFPQLRAVRMSELERDRFYYGFSNAVLWPLLHGIPGRCVPRAGQWESYEKVNRRFARALDRTTKPGDLVWVHDYHLMLVGRELRRLGARNRTAFFLHTPFPRPEILETLAEHRALVRALLAFDLVGFQNVRDRDNFVEMARTVVTGGYDRGEPGDKRVAEALETRTGAFPISIDFEEFSTGAEQPLVLTLAREIRRNVGDRTLLLGVDRLDYTKGIPERLRGLDHALQRYPDLRGHLVLKQLVVPSRESLPAYSETRREIERLVTDINSRWQQDDWRPVEYEYGTWERAELLAHYRVADVALVTPLNDGMNLVAKEYCAANSGSGVLILSAFAGAAAELGHGALLVNPVEPAMTAAAIRSAHHMSGGERVHRMASLKGVIRDNHVHRWVDSFLETAG